MSGIVTLPVILPIITPMAPIGWPFLLPAIGAAAAVMGFTAVRNRVKNQVEVKNAVDIQVNNAEEVGAGLNLAESLSFERDGVTITFARDANGEVAVRVEGDLADDELTAIGEQAAHALVQQYAYHRLVTEMKDRGMNIVDEYVDEDGTVRLKARVFQS